MKITEDFGQEVDFPQCHLLAPGPAEPDVSSQSAWHWHPSGVAERGTWMVSVPYRAPKIPQKSKGMPPPSGLLAAKLRSLLWSLLLPNSSRHSQALLRVTPLPGVPPQGQGHVGATRVALPKGAKTADARQNHGCSGTHKGPHPQTQHGPRALPRHYLQVAQQYHTTAHGTRRHLTFKGNCQALPKSLWHPYASWGRWQG